MITVTFISTSGLITNEVIIRSPDGIMISTSQSTTGDQESIGIEMTSYGEKVFSSIYYCDESPAATIEKLRNIIRMDKPDDNNQIKITKERIPDPRGYRSKNRLLVVQDLQTVVRC